MCELICISQNLKRYKFYLHILDKGFEIGWSNNLPKVTQLMKAQPGIKPECAKVEVSRPHLMDFAHMGLCTWQCSTWLASAKLQFFEMRLRLVV